MSKDVLVISTSYMNQKISGNNRHNFIPEFLTRKGFNVEKISSDFNHHTKTRVSKPDNHLPYKVKLISTTIYKKNVSIQRIISQKVFAKNLKKYLNERKVPDIIYLFVPSMYASEVVRKYAKKNKVKLIIDIRDLWPEAFRMVFNVPILSDLIFYPQRSKANRIYKAADEIIAVSETYLNRALEVNNNVEKGHTIFLGTDLKEFDKQLKHDLTQSNNQNFKMAYVGTLGNSYDLETVFKSMEILEKKYVDIELRVFGSGPLENKFKNMAEKLGINVYFYGRLPYSDLVPKIVECDIALNPIRKGAAQSIINKHADYAAAGLPVVNSQENLEYRRMVRDYNIGLNANNNDYKDMAIKIEKLYHNPKLRETMSKNHRKLAELKFDRSHIYDTIVDII